MYLLEKQCAVPGEYKVKCILIIFYTILQGDCGCEKITFITVNIIFKNFQMNG